jgi:hypothetical protein
MCQLTRGFARDCNNSISAIKNIYISNKELAGAATQNATGQITAFAAATGTPFKKYELNDQNADWKSTPAVNEQNGTCFFANLINFTVPKSEQAKRNEFKLLANGDGATVIAEGFDGRYWAMGFLNGARWTGGDLGVGRNFGDLNGFNVSLTANETEPPAEIAYSAFSALVEANA